VHEFAVGEVENRLAIREEFEVSSIDSHIDFRQLRRKRQLDFSRHGNLDIRAAAHGDHRFRMPLDVHRVGASADGPRPLEGQILRIAAGLWRDLELDSERVGKILTEFHQEFGWLACFEHADAVFHDDAHLSPERIQHARKGPEWSRRQVKREELACAGGKRTCRRGWSLPRADGWPRNDTCRRGGENRRSMEAVRYGRHESPVLQANAFEGFDEGLPR
jgi:hypothetical protein